jgi:hypothetical protein
MINVAPSNLLRNRGVHDGGLSTPHSSSRNDDGASLGHSIVHSVNDSNGKVCCVIELHETFDRFFTIVSQGPDYSELFDQILEISYAYA